MLILWHSYMPLWRPGWTIATRCWLVGCRKTVRDKLQLVVLMSVNGPPDWWLAIVKPMTHLKVVSWKSLSSKENFQMWHTHLHKFLLACESQLSEIEWVLFLKVFFLQALSCDWPVRNTWHYWPEFRGCNTMHDNWKWDFSSKITTNIIIVVIKLNLHSQYSSTREAMPLLTCNFYCSTCKCILEK